MKRFYNEVSVEPQDGQWQVMLDGRGIKTVMGSAQLVPTQQLAKALAAEWEAQGDEINTGLFQFRDMADYAIDMIAPAPSEIAQKLVAYGDTDTILYRADPDEPLYARQIEVWEPILTAFEQRMGAKFTRISGIIHRDQPDETLACMRDALDRLAPFALAGLETMTSLAASLIIAMSALEAEDTAAARALWDAASLEEDWQAELWGRDKEAEERRARRQADFLAAYRFTQLASFG